MGTKAEAEENFRFPGKILSFWVWKAFLEIPSNCSNICYRPVSKQNISTC